jgi:hypothetical protein
MQLFVTAVGALALAAGQPGDFGTVTGKVVLKAPPAPAEVNVTTDRDHCLSKGKLTSQEVIADPKTGALKNAIVYLRPDNTDRNATFPKDRIHPSLAAVRPTVFEIDQPCCQFEPRVFAVREQTKLVIKNSSPVNHNANFQPESDAFNVSIPPGGAKESAPLKPESGLIVLKCDVHPWMKGVGMVFDHPYFAVTDDAGSFTLGNVPAGKWRLVYRHEKGYHKGKDGRFGWPIEVKAGENKLPTLEFEFAK